MLGERFWNWRKRGLNSEIDRAIRKHGWFAIYVGDYVSAPTWAYSIGFQETLAAPEIVLFDVPKQTANDVFWRIFQELKSGDLRISDRGLWEGMGMPLAWRRVHEDQLDGPEGWFALAKLRWIGRIAAGQTVAPLEVYQLVLPDEDGHLPWDEGYDERLRPLQPALWEPPADLTGA